MNDRVKSILTLLIQDPGLTTTELSQKLGLTKRQINYAISQFNQYQRDHNLPVVNRNNAGKFEVPMQLGEFFSPNSISNYDNTHSPSEHEKIALLLMTLILQNDYVSLNHFTDCVMASKNTVLEYIKKAEKIAQKYNLHIDYNRQSGYHLTGSEHFIIQLLTDLTKQCLIFQNDSIKENFSINISQDDVLYVIHSMEQMLHLSYSDESLDYLQTSIYYLVARAVNYEMSTKFFEGHVNKTPEYRILYMILEDTSWSLTRSYKEWMTLLFLSSNIFEKKTSQVYDSDIELIELITEMVSTFEEQTLIQIKERHSFEKRILNHLRPACFRIKYNLSLGVYSFNSIIKESSHNILFELMKEIIIPIEKYLGKAFPFDELDLLSYYFGYQLSNNSREQKPKPRAAVVCRNGVMVSKLIKDNLINLFPELHFVGSFSTRDFRKFSEDLDVIFTTTPIDNTELQFIVKPIMTYREQINLRYRALTELGLYQIDQTLEELIDMIKKYAEIKNSSCLREELQMFLMSNHGITRFNHEESLPSLTYFLKPHFVQVHQEPLDWKEAVKIASLPLLDHQIITEEFITDCINQIEQSDYSGFLGDSICIPHTTTDHGVIRDGVSLLVTKRPVIFPNGMSLNIIASLSFANLTQHLKAINQLADISLNKELLNQIISSERSIDIYQLIRKYT